MAYEMETEKQKMLAGKLYDACDKELVHERNLARERTALFNATQPSEVVLRKQLIKALIVSDGEVNIEQPFYCDYGYNIEAGDNFFANFNCIILDVNKVTIGKNVMFGPNVQIYTATHPLLAEERIKGLELSIPITIGDNVWLGGGVIISPGVCIGDNTTIGAGSVVTKDIPANVFAAGNPCKVIKKIE